MGVIAAWFDIIFGALASVTGVALVFAPLPRRWRTADYNRFKARPLFVRLLYLSGVELISLAIIFQGIYWRQGADWGWTSLLILAGLCIAIWSLLGAPHRLPKRRGVRQP